MSEAQAPHGASGDLDWSVDGPGWPNAAASRFVQASGLRWHVQEMGEGPVLLLIHGTGASTHSWRDLMPLLAAHYRVVAPDLPGHGFTGQPARRRLSLPGMANALADLLDALGTRPVLAVGHSAGAAILARAILDERLAPERIYSLNGALLPFSGVAAFLFPTLAKALFLNPLAPRFFAWGAGDMRRVRRLIHDNGPRVDERGVQLYARLLRSPAHVGAALGMMAQWDLQPLVRDLPRLATPLVLVAGDGDRAVPPRHADQVAAMVPRGRVLHLAGLGHLAHEEDAPRLVRLLREVELGQDEAAARA